MARHFSQRAAIRFGLTPCQASEADVGLLVAYDWPGNIRELGAVIDRAAILGDGKSLEVAKALGVQTSPVVLSAPAPQPPATPVPAKIVTLDEAMRQHIELALRASEGRIEGPKGAARVLAINPHTLRAADAETGHRLEAVPRRRRRRSAGRLWSAVIHHRFWPWGKACPREKRR